MRFGNPDRRHSPRGEPNEPRRPELVQRVRGTFEEMPGLEIALTDAARLFGVSERTCAVVLRDLAAAGTVRPLPDGRFTGS
jgi:hypothetical protein